MVKHLASEISLLGDFKQVTYLCLSLFCKKENNSSTYLEVLMYRFNEMFSTHPSAQVLLGT